MARIWNQYTAYDGKKYYYNVKTKQSTWNKPSSSYEEENEHPHKKVKFDNVGRPYLVLPLMNGWALVICDNGSKFFHSTVTNDSVWELPDEQSLELLNSVERQKLVFLVGVARGYNSPNAKNIYEEVLADLERMRREQSALNVKQGEAEVPADASPKQSAVEQNDSSTAVTGQLIEGYSSSEEDGSEDDEIESPSETFTEQDADLDELNMLEDMSTDPQNQISERDKTMFFDLLTRNQCDPYSAWIIEARKIQQDPAFYQITDDDLKESLFEDWCQRSLANEFKKDDEELQHDQDGGEKFERNEKEEEQEDDEGESQGDEEEEEELEPTKFHYLAHLVAKSEITPHTIFLDIKEQNKALFKKYKIKDFIKSKKEQSAFVSELLYFYKRKGLEERKNIFRDLLKENERLIKENISSYAEALKLILKDDERENRDAFDTETQLLKLEKIIGIHGELKELTVVTTYYVLGIKDKFIELRNYLKTLMEI